MAILFILFVIILVIYFSFNSYLQHIIEVYLENNKVKHLKPIGIDENAFIGLHKKELALKEAYMIYARKTTAYKGVILFNPDANLTYRFYMPLINFLCRQGAAQNSLVNWSSQFCNSLCLVSAATFLISSTD